MIFAVDGTWLGTVDQADNGSWNDPANWGGTVPGGAGSVLTFPNATLGSQLASTHLDAPFTVGVLSMGMGSRNWTINAGTGGVLTFDNGSAMPEIQTTGGTRAVMLDVPVAGTHGLKLAGVAKSYVVMNAANTYSGETLITAPYLRLAADAAAGDTTCYRLATVNNAEVYLYIDTGMTLDKDVHLLGQPESNKRNAHLGFMEAGAGDAVVNGDIYCASPNGCAQIFTDNADTPVSTRVVINGDILPESADVASNIGLRGDARPCVINGRINLPNGTLTKNGGATYTLNHADNVWSGTTVVFSGTLKMGATNAYSVGNALQLTEYGTGGTFDLNGYDQTIGALFKSGCATAPYRITSEAPAVLTMNVTDDNGNNSINKGWVVFDGALTIRKTGAGTQTFSQKADTGDTTVLVSGGLEILDGTLHLNNALTTAKITVDGGTLDGTSALQYTSGAPETFRLKAGQANVSSMQIAFTNGEVPRGKHLVFDYSEGGSLTGAEGSDVYPFASSDKVPEGCLWRHSPATKKCFLIHPDPATMVIVL